MHGKNLHENCEKSENSHFSQCNFLEKTGTKIAKRMAYACVCHFFVVILQQILENATG